MTKRQKDRKTHKSEKHRNRKTNQRKTERRKDRKTEKDRKEERKTTISPCVQTGFPDPDQTGSTSDKSFGSEGSLNPVLYFGPEKLFNFFVRGFISGKRQITDMTIKTFTILYYFISFRT